LFIAIDDLNDWGVSALKGRKGVHTPNIDSLAEMGVLFTNANCAAPACNPSRTALLTGLRPSTTGIYENYHDWRLNHITNKVTTLPQYFKKRGYHVIGTGKIFHALEWQQGDEDGYNDAKCWDQYYPSYKKQMPPRLLPDAPLPLVKRSKKDGILFPPDFFDWGFMGHPVKQMPDDQVVDWAINQLNTPQTKPLFMAVGLFKPHIPWYIPEEFYKKYPLDSVALPYVQKGWLDKLPPASHQSGDIRRKWHQWIKENNHWKEAVQAYLAAISFSDYELGRLIDGLKKSPLYKNTVIVLWTDHGFHAGDKDTWEKFTLWEESTRVPLIMVVPGVTQPHSKCAQPVSLIDLYPTLVDIVDHKKIASLEGSSFLAQLKDPKLKRNIPSLCTNSFNNHSVRDERYHYIRYNNGDEELYDHYTDEGEWNNLANNPAYAGIKENLKKWLPKTNAEPQKEVNASFSYSKQGAN